MADPHAQPRTPAWEPSPESHPEPVPLVSQADLVNPMLKVADAMSAGPRTCSPYSSVVEAVLIFRDADCGAVPVVQGGKPVGILTDRDVALALPERQAGLAAATVEEVMSRDVVTIDADATLDVAMDRLGEHGVRRLLVVDSGGALVGVLSVVDLIPFLSERGMGRVIAQIAEHR